MKGTFGHTVDYLSSELNSTPVSHIHSDHPHGGADRAAAGVSAAPVGPPRHVFGCVVGVLVDDDVGLGAEDLLVEGLQLGNPELSFSGVVIFHGVFSAKRPHRVKFQAKAVKFQAKKP